MKSYKINNLNIDFWQSSKPDNDKTLIILMGLPGKPKEYEIISKFNNSGFNVLLPHYEGTWQSDGRFLERSPSLSIDELINKIDSENIYVLGSSFGGWVGMGLSDNKKIKKICVTSPVISFKKVTGIETLSNYMRESFPNDYRFDDLDWNKLLNDQIQNPEEGIKLNSDKVMILTGKEDSQINYTDVEGFVEKNHISNFYLEDCGHITPSKITAGQFDKILNFFNTEDGL